MHGAARRRQGGKDVAKKRAFCKREIRAEKVPTITRLRGCTDMGVQMVMCLIRTPVWRWIGM